MKRPSQANRLGHFVAVLAVLLASTAASGAADSRSRVAGSRVAGSQVAGAQVAGSQAPGSQLSGIEVGIGTPVQPSAVRVEGLDPELLQAVSRELAGGDSLPKLLEVRVEGAAGDGMPTVLGRLIVDGQVLLFIPRFPLGSGLRFEVVLSGAEQDRLSGRAGATTPDFRTVIETPDPRGPRAEVVAVYPASRRVPANLLRLYLHFSTPMRPREIARSIRLEDADGVPIETAFVEITDGLWDPSERRLTLFLHPGRIKRGVGPRQVLGPVLVPGERYTLVVDGSAVDASGRAIGEDFRQPLLALEPDRSSPDPSAWRIVAPTRSDAPLQVRFDEPLDRALLDRMIEIQRDSHPVHGRLQVHADDSGISFRPEEDWAPGAHEIVVYPGLEDRAGNRPGALFDRPEGHAEVEPGPTPRPIRLPFTTAF